MPGIADCTDIPDTKPGYYYVSFINGNKYGLLVGPFKNDHQKALNMIEAARHKAQELDDYAWFLGFGTCRITLDTPNPPVGRLNKYFGPQPDTSRE